VSGGGLATESGEPGERKLVGARILITSFGSYGDTFPYVGLALGLKARGHRPVLAMPGFYRELVTGEGLDFHAVRPDVDPTDRELVRRIMDPLRGPEFIIRHLLLRNLEESYRDLAVAAEGVDLIVSHPITFAAPVIGDREGIPWVSTVLAPLSFLSRHDLPVFPVFGGVKALERVPGVAAALAGLTRVATRPWGRPVNQLRRRLGLPAVIDPVWDGQHSARLVLALFSRVLAEPAPDWPAATRVTGAIPYNGPDADRPLDPELAEFIAAGPPPIVFTLGSSAVGVAGDFYSISLDAARAIGARAILLVGPHADNRPRGSPGADVMLVPFAPHSALFPRASVVVHQGGAGTLHQGFRSGRPTLIVPYAHDQPDHAYRAERLGVSRTLTPRRYTLRRVTSALQALTADPGYATAAAAVAARVRAEDGVTAACDAIESVLQAR
jgi:rhamnosyltransferase subunit B